MDILLMLPGFILSLILTVVYERELRKSQNKVHFYVARDKNGVLCLYISKPFRRDTQFCPNIRNGVIVSTLTQYHFKIFGLNEKDYANLEWEDEPVEVFLNMED